MWPMLAWDPRRRARRTGIATVIAAVLRSGGIAATPAGASPEDDLAKKRAQAEALEADIAENGTRISILDEEFNQTQIAIETANTALAENEERLDAAARRTEALRTEVASSAAFLYVGASSGGPLPTTIPMMRNPTTAPERACPSSCSGMTTTNKARKYASCNAIDDCGATATAIIVAHTAASATRRAFAVGVIP